MVEQSLWQRFIAAVDREYERRIRAASLVTEYGAHHEHHADDDDVGEVAVIANVPRGSRLDRHLEAHPHDEPPH